MIQDEVNEGFSLMRMNMSDFATFFAVARNQSFRAAGDELGLSSSAISHSIKTLEQRLEIRLFNRTTRSVSLTEAGSNLYGTIAPSFRRNSDHVRWDE